MAQVKLSDGTLLEVPDNPTAGDLKDLEAAEAVAAKKVSGSYGNAFRKGLQDLPALSVGLGNTIVENVKEAVSGNSRFSIPTSVQQLKERAGRIGQRFSAGQEMGRLAAEPILGRPMEPTGFGPKAVRNTVANLPFAAGMGPVKHLLTSAGAGMGQAAGSEMTDGSALGEFGGGVGGYILSAALGNKLGLGTTAGDVVGAAAKDLSPEDYAKASALQSRARSQGIQLTPGQLFDRPTGIQGLEQEIGQSGTPAAGFLQNQRQRAATQGRDAAGRFISSVGESGRSPVDVQKEVEKAAQDRIARLNRIPGRLAREQYRPTDSAYPYNPGRDTIMDPAGMMDLREQLIQAARKVNSPAVMDLAENVGINQAERTAPRTMATGANPTGRMRDFRMSTLNDLYNLTKANMDLPAENPKAITRYEQKKVGDALGSIDDALAGVQRDRPGGKVTTREAYERIVEPRLRGLTGFAAPEGRVAGSMGPDEATKQFFAAIGDTTRYRSKDIEMFAKDLRKTDPKLFEQYYRQYLEQSFDVAMKPQKGVEPQQALTTFVANVYGTPQQKNNIKAAVAAIARNKGVNETDAVRAMDDVMQVVEAATRAPVSAVKSGAAEAQRLPSNPATTMARSIGMFSQGALGTRIAQVVDAQRKAKIVKLLQDPEALIKIRELASKTPGQRRLEAIESAIVKSMQTNEE